MAILKEDRPYERRDEAGNPITASEAKAIIEARYTVPEEVRKQRTRRARKERQERREGKKKSVQAPACART